MLKPVLETLELDPDLCRRIREPILNAVFAAAAKDARSELSITEVKELLAVALPHYREPVSRSLRAGDSIGAMPLQGVGVLLHSALHQAALYFRREGARIFREVQSEPNVPKRAERLWGAFFSRRLLLWLQASGRLDEVDALESVDAVVEASRLWVADLASRIGGRGSELAPAEMFLDTESSLKAELEWQGRRLTVKGRPDAVMLDRAAERPEIVEYKLGVQGQLELQVAQTFLYLEMLNAAKGPGIERARLQLFRLEGETPPDAPEPRSTEAHPISQDSGFPPEVEAAFEGYVGNVAAVRRLKIECALARRESPPSMPVNVMLCGPGGLGKTELARRVARALGVPMVDVPASSVKDVDGLLELVDGTLDSAGQSSEPAGTDSGLPRVRYPPLVVFLDEVHLLKRKADLFLQLFEPRERRAVGSDKVGDFAHATLLAATTDKGLRPGPFLTRFRMVDLVPYEASEVARILAPAFEPGESVPSEEFLVRLSRMSRLNPRIGIERAREMLTHHRFDPDAYPLDSSGLDRMAAESWEVDEQGLRPADLDYLGALQQGRRGLAALCQMLPVGRDEILNIIEPYLMQLGLVRPTGSGRELTERGRLVVTGNDRGR